MEPADHSDGHGGHGGALVPDEPIANPGVPEHLPRPTDVDPAKEKRAERQVAGFFGLSAICTILFAISYFTFDVGDNWHVVGGLGASTVALGGTLGLSLLFIGIAIIHWSRKLMGDDELVEMRHPAYSGEADRQRTLDDLRTGYEETGIARRPLIVRSALGSLALLGVPAVILLRDLGPLPGDKLYHTIWGQGGRKITVIEDGEEVEVEVPKMRISRDAIGTPILASDLEIGDLVNAQPEVLFNPERYYVPHAEVEGAALQTHKSKASLILLRMEPEDIKPGKGREDWSVNGIVAYSKICTHVGCPISLNERTTHHLLCPCHQSTFDMTDSGNVIFGPAGRPLPQLPIEIDDQGYLVAQSDFTEPVGPSFWERDYEER
ncbi:Rieske 2Fe-2S domain-containing protein [Nocardioides sp. HM23]|uniref:cytochrome bc1 complex Rieske iron-sulfur subunit n=1 Tax=Nocardioides bizhenqiangii TaxID=3095076 RepID=UPI002ACA03BD|nr:Rieske 2Fe-2S domain-containing protein [Nocardioides sp. HM23]MDZ5620720.1 Rieske 2Fe-2S domain-containing protein [Nocardioides sp. HM23]